MNNENEKNKSFRFRLPSRNTYVTIRIKDGEIVLMQNEGCRDESNHLLEEGQSNWETVIEILEDIYKYDFFLFGNIVSYVDDKSVSYYQGVLPAVRNLRRKNFEKIASLEKDNKRLEKFLIK